MCGKTEFGIHILDRCNNTCAGNVGIGFHARNALHPATPPFFLLEFVEVSARVQAAMSGCRCPGRACLAKAAGYPAHVSHVDLSVVVEVTPVNPF